MNLRDVRKMRGGQRTGTCGTSLRDASSRAFSTYVPRSTSAQSPCSISLWSPRTFLPIVVPALAFLLTTGCSASYNGERLFWKAQQVDAPIVKDPKSATSQQIANAIHAFEVVIQKVPGTMWAARAHIAIGSLYAMQKDYGKARKVFGDVLQNYNQFPSLCLAARFTIAKTYELEQDWSNAVKTYQAISEYYPWTTIGLESPLYIAKLFEAHQQPDLATDAYERAISFYTKLIPNAPQPELAAQIKSYLALTYQRLGRWEQEAATLENLAQMPSGANRPLILLSLGSLYESKLNNAGKAQKTYTTLANEFPEHPLGKAAKMRLEHLGITIIPTTPSRPTTTP